MTHCWVNSSFALEYSFPPVLVGREGLSPDAHPHLANFQNLVIISCVCVFC